MVDEKRLGFSQGVDLSFLSKKSQQIVADAIERSKCTVSMGQSAKLKEYEKKNELTSTVVRLILEEKNVHATLFVSDTWAKNYPELLCTIHNAGHDIGGLWTTQASLSIREQTLTLENLTQRIDRLTDSETTLFRFEDGNYDNSAIRLIQESGGYPVQWNINSMDWKDYGAQDILHRILNSRQLQNGSILLFHAGTVYTAQALPDLIDNLEDQGYQPVPISELIWKHSYYMDADGVQIPKTEP